MSILCAYLMVVTRRHNLFQVFFIHYHFRSEALFRSHGGGGTVVIPAFRRLREEASSILYMVNQTTMGQHSRTSWVLLVIIYFVQDKTKHKALKYSRKPDFHLASPRSHKKQQHCLQRKKTVHHPHKEPNMKGANPMYEKEPTKTRM